MVLSTCALCWGLGSICCPFGWGWWVGVATFSALTLSASQGMAPLYRWGNRGPGGSGVVMC